MSIDEDFKGLRAAYPRLKEQCESQVVSWKWSKTPHTDPRPFWFERERSKPGKFVDAPAHPSGYYESGFDAAGRLVVQRQHVFAEAERKTFYEMFYHYAENQVEAAVFDHAPEKEPISFSRSRYADEHIITWEARYRENYAHETYHWAGSRLTQIDVDRAEVSGSTEAAELVHWQQIVPGYDPNGVLETLVVHWLKTAQNPEASSETVYRRVQKSNRLRALCQQAQVKLVEAIQRKIAALAITEPVYCLGISWSPGQFSSLPPCFGLGTAAEREQWLGERGPEAKWFIWNVAEFAHFYPDDSTFDAETLRLCELINQEMGRRDRWEDGRKLLNDVAQSLSASDWKGILQPTQDFVVFACDAELSDLRQNLKRTAPKAIYQQFLAKDWV